MGLAAYQVVIYIGSDPVGVTDTTVLPISDGTNGQFKYNMPDQVLDRDGKIRLNTNFNSSDVADLSERSIDSDQYSINRYTGNIIILEDFSKFDANNHKVKITANAVNISKVMFANSISLDLSTTVLDNTGTAEASANGGFRRKCYGLLDISCSLSQFFDVGLPYRSLTLSKKPVLLKFDFKGQTAMGWFVTETDGLSGDVDSLEDREFSFQLDGKPETSFHWE